MKRQTKVIAKKNASHGIRLMILAGVMLYVMSIVSLQISTFTAFAGDENIDVNPNFEKELLKEDTEPEVKDEFQSLDGEEVKATVLFEDTSKRTPTEKHFKMSDGSYVANIFSYDVHYLENNKYEEIDNSLVKTAKGSYTNHKNRFKVELPQSIQDGAKSKVSVDGYSLSFTLLNQKAGKVKEPLVKNLSDSKVIKAQKDFKYDLKTQSRR